MARSTGNSQLAIRVLVGINALETLALAGFGILLVVELFIATPDSMASALFLAAMVIAAAVALGFITKGLWEGKTSARSASLRGRSCREPSGSRAERESLLVTTLRS